MKVHRNLIPLPIPLLFFPNNLHVKLKNNLKIEWKKTPLKMLRTPLKIFIIVIIT